ncbi:Nto1p NDAI_0A01320 [Naumovozyma dairenensis CBS 421]|uniref:PHD-type domain-containing protein n=1 Tax=Naumovozyma dairenensis (strain ATCC 10597 / BCRC 20456 / CBS 421 / NBRC 0211 / NRRL Y-12639) TaxID=1071378 RepID=G0W3A2_NAUDC|nr:hypothetical protein NDAI_0A01320 [Naumovozyma dairenensis CBS 421]CCD22290.1 hypothetical protein NDAI_0A01320 [Naumovozyma dairenensis CBS 421]
MSAVQNNNDDGLKLREEKHYNDFYPTLTDDTEIDVVIDLDNTAQLITEPIVGNGIVEPHTVQPIKQLMYNGQVTIEALRMDHNIAEFKKCPFELSKLDSIRFTESEQSLSLQSQVPESDSDIGKAYINEFESGIEKRYTPEQLGILNSLKLISPHLDKFIIEYDMDEQDELFLQHLRQLLSLVISHELFELLITVLEKEWFTLQSHIPRDNIYNADLTTKARINHELYGSDDGTTLSSDQPCAICYGTNSDVTNTIVFCDGCNIAVHQECYGIVFIPVDSWLCRRCQFGNNDPDIGCIVCPSKTGAFKMTDNGIWIHNICALWLPELYFANLHYMEPIEGIGNIPSSRWKLFCYICKKRMGACIQCTHKNCFLAYHVTCARRAGLYLKWDRDVSVGSVASNQVHLGNKLHSFCDKHSPVGWPSCTQNLLKTRRFFNIEINSTYSTNIALQEPSDWRTPVGTPIAPQYFATILQKILKLYKFTPAKSQTLSYEVCKYWSMKREWKRGPLIHKPQLENVSFLTSNDIENRLDFTKLLLKDLKKLKKLTELITKRVEVESSLRTHKKIILQLLNDPRRYLLKTCLIDKVVGRKEFKFLMKSTRDEHTEIQLEKFRRDQFESLEQIEGEIIPILQNMIDAPMTPIMTRRNIIKLKDYMLASIAEFRLLDPERYLMENFSIKDKKTLDIKPRLWKGPLLMDEEDLTDVEELDESQSELLQNILTGTNTEFSNGKKPVEHEEMESVTSYHRAQQHENLPRKGAGRGRRRDRGRGKGRGRGRGRLPGSGARTVINDGAGLNSERVQQTTPPVKHRGWPKGKKRGRRTVKPWSKKKNET